MLLVLHSNLMRDHTAVVTAPDVQPSDARRASVVVQMCMAAVFHGACIGEHVEVVTWLAGLSHPCQRAPDVIRELLSRTSTAFISSVVQLFPAAAEDIVNIGCNMFSAACITMRQDIVRRFVTDVFHIEAFVPRAHVVVARAKRSVRNMMNIPVVADPVYKGILEQLDSAYPYVAAEV